MDASIILISLLFCGLSSTIINCFHCIHPSNEVVINSDSDSDLFYENNTTKILNTVDNNEICAMCTDPILLSEEISRLPCTHIFHNTKECHLILDWINKTQTCPICMININQ